MESFGKSDADCDKESQLQTPYSDWDCDTFVASMKEDSRSLSSSSWDLEPESVIPSAILYQEGMSVNVGVEGPSECTDQLKEDYLDLKQPNQFGIYDELLKQFIKNEEELRVSNYKLEHSEEEIAKLKIQIEQCEGQLDDVQKELKQKDGDLEYEKGQVLEMQKQKAELRDCCDKITKSEKMLEMVAIQQLKISSNEIARLTKELESKLSETHELQGQLKVAEERVTKLECEFDSGRKQIQDLEKRITWYKTNETKLKLEVQKLKAEMIDVLEEFSLEKDKLYCDIQSLSKTNEDLTSTINEYENKLMEYAIANLKQKELYAALKDTLKGEINSLKEEVGQKKHDVEAVNNEFDMYKQKFHMVVTEREEANAKIDMLKAEIISREDQIKRLKSNDSTSLHIFKEPVLKVEALARELIRQKGVISNLEVEKEEAIRQVENYRTKYQQLPESSDDHRCLIF